MQVFKIHSDFYYVQNESTTYECKLRANLKKQKAQVYVGDFVEIDEINEKSKQALKQAKKFFQEWRKIKCINT